MSTVITVENLGKKYTLHHQQREQYTALRDVIAESVKGAGRRVASLFSDSPFTLHCSPQLEGGKPAGGGDRFSSGVDGAGEYLS